MRPPSLCGSAASETATPLGAPAALTAAVAVADTGPRALMGSVVSVSGVRGTAAMSLPEAVLPPIAVSAAAAAVRATVVASICWERDVS